MKGAMGGNRLRVLHVVANLALHQGGPPRSVLGLAGAQAGAGGDVTVAAGGFQHGVNPVGEANGVTILHGRHWILPFEIPNLRLVFQLKRQIQRVDLVHIHGVWNGTVTVAAVLCRCLDKPFVVSPRGMLDGRNVATRRPGFKRLYYCLLERANLAAAAGWHFLDESERAGCTWMKFPHRNVNNVLISPNGLNTAKVAEKAEGDPFPVRTEPGVMTLLFLGRLHPIKGLELQLELLPLLASRGIHARLWLVGPDDGAKARLERRAKELGVTEWVRFVGSVFGDERFAMLRRADAVLLTSHNECNSNAAAETLAAGGLLVATDTCHVDVPAGAGAGIVVPRSADALADMLTELMTSPERCKTVRQAARRFSMERLDWSTLAVDTLAFYQRILFGEDDGTITT